MTFDPLVLPGLSLLALELLVLAAIGFVVARIALGQTDDRMALAQGMVIGPAIWGLVVSFLLHAFGGQAGALAGWIVILAGGVSLAWRGRAQLRVAPRTLAGIGTAALAIFWVGLASRQLLGIPDDAIHTALPATIRAGAYPPELAWSPGVPLAYHFGADLLIGLLTPPVGPDLAFVTELMGAYLWTGLVLVVVTLLRDRGSWLSAIVLAPLLLTAGAWTLIWFTPADILRIPVPTGLPAAGVRASMGSVYWPAADLAWTWPSEASPPNIWKPPFLLGYGLAIIVLERLSTSEHRRFLAQVGFALLVGFLGMVEETVALTVLGIWALYEGLDLWIACRAGSLSRIRVTRAVVGPALTVILLAAGGGLITGILTGTPRSALAFGWRQSPSAHELLATFSDLPGNVGLLSLGAVPVVLVALLVGWKYRLVAAFALGCGAFALVAVTLQHPAHPPDVVRLDGHARNFALLALLVALSARLSALAPRWQYAAAGALVAVLIWPTSVTPVRNIVNALPHGVWLRNAVVDESHSPWWGRYILSPSMSARISAFIRNQTPLDARVLSPHPHELTAVTGRPNASGPAGHLNLLPFDGPEYVDALRFLEPGAVQRLGLDYVHAVDAWVEVLPEYAQRWLDDRRYFTPLIRDGTHVLYRVEPAFLELDSVYASGSFEALRRAVPDATPVYLAPSVEPHDPIRYATIRLVLALSHARLLGSLDLYGVYLLTDLPNPVRPLDGQTPDLVVMPGAASVPSALAADRRAPIWWNDELALFAPTGAIPRLMAPPPGQFRVELSEVRVSDSGIAFRADFKDGAPNLWVGQDWLVTAADNSPWAFPREFETDARHRGRQWFAGQVAPGDESASFSFEFDPRAVRLGVAQARGSLEAVASSGTGLGPGVWTLGVRLRQEWHEAAFIPVMKIVVAEGGDVTFEVYEGELNARLAQ